MTPRVVKADPVNEDPAWSDPHVRELIEVTAQVLRRKRAREAQERQTA